MEKQFMSVKEFAAATGAHPNTVSNWIKSGKIIASQLDKKIMIPISEIERLKEGGAV